MTGKALDVWAHARTQIIDLPSGAGRASVEALDLTEAVALGRIPNPLRGIALKADSGELNKAEFGEEDAKAWLELQAMVVASSVRDFRPKKGSKTSETLEVEWVKTKMPPSDRERIFYTATHVVTADTLRGLMSLGPFRGGSPGADASEGGDGDGESAE